MKMGCFEPELFLYIIVGLFTQVEAWYGWKLLKSTLAIFKLVCHYLLQIVTVYPYQF